MARRPSRAPGLFYRWHRYLLSALVRPQPSGIDPCNLTAQACAQPDTAARQGQLAPAPVRAPTATAPQLPDAPPPAIIYVLEYRSTSDLIALDLVTQANNLPGPFAPITVAAATHPRRFFYLNRPHRGRYRAARDPGRLSRLAELLEAASVSEPAAVPDGLIVPVTVFWGRAPSGQGSLPRLLLSEHWKVTSRLKRLVNIFLSRHDIRVHFGPPVTLAELLARGGDGRRLLSRLDRLLRVRIRRQRVAVLGPDLSHQRTLVAQVVQSGPVQQVINEASTPAERAKREATARRQAERIASNLSFPTIRILERLLAWFWNRIYRGIDVGGIERVQALAPDHTLVYVPSHRSHLDYLLLSFLLFRNGLMLPHIAAGDNLNLPVVGNILRRAGAFFMRRSFRGDALYSAVFSEYLREVYRRGHSVEFFPEGGRTRTGRLLPARIGLLKMTLEHHARGLPRPLVFVPVYFGYEKLVEAASYLDELRGAEKQRESIGDVVRSLRLIRQNFGRVTVRFGEPLPLDAWLTAHAPERAERDAAALAPVLGAEIMQRINASAAINPVNLVAMVTLTMPRLALDERTLVSQIGLLQALLQQDAAHHDYGITPLPPDVVIAEVESLGLLQRETTTFGPVLGHGPVAAILMTWYRNNVIHTLAMPSLLACLIRNRRRPVDAQRLTAQLAVVAPFVSEELSTRLEADDVTRWLGHMADLGLVVQHDAGYQPPAPRSPRHYALRLLARIIMPVLERLYIVVALLVADDVPVTRETLQQRSVHVATRIARLYDLNAPEFFDPRLFNQFVDALLREELISERADGTLLSARLIDDVLRAAETVIDPEIRFAVLQPD